MPRQDPKIATKENAAVPMQRRLAARRRTDEARGSEQPPLGTVNAIRVRSPLAREQEEHARQQKQHGDPQRNRRRSGAAQRSVQSGHRSGAAVGQQELGFLHVVGSGMGVGIEGELVTQPPGKDTDSQQDEGGRKDAQTPAAPEQESAAFSC
jgi:hypothetical protein